MNLSPLVLAKRPNARHHPPRIQRRDGQVLRMRATLFAVGCNEVEVPRHTQLALSGLGAAPPELDERVSAHPALHRYLTGDINGYVIQADMRLGVATCPPVSVSSNHSRL